MSGTKSTSKPSPEEEVIPLDDVEEDPTVIVITDDGKKIKQPAYFECSEEFEAFDGDFVEPKESSSS